MVRFNSASLTEIWEKRGDLTPPLNSGSLDAASAWSGSRERPASIFYLASDPVSVPAFVKFAVPSKRSL